MMVRTPSADRGSREGTTLDLNALLDKRNEKEKEKDKRLAWTSTDIIVATVDATGLVTAQDTGVVWIVVDYKDMAADTITIVVIPVPVASVTITGADSISLDDTVQVSATPRDSVGEPLLGRPVTWATADPLIASVATDGTVIGLAVGTCSTTSEYMWVSPGVAQVRTQLATVAADIARRYGPAGLKGIHLDRIRFPSNQVSYDGYSQEAFRVATGAYPSSNAQASWLNFRRGFVNQGVKEVFDSVQLVNSSMVLSAAVFPGYMPRPGWSAQWSFTDLFQDPQAWAQGGYLDVAVVMNYPATATSTSWTVKAYCSNTDWTCVMDDHIARIEGQSGRQVYVGVGAIKGWTEVSKQLDLAHDRNATGVSVYSYSQVDAIPNGWAQLASGPFKNKASIPAMGWKQ